MINIEALIRICSNFMIWVIVYLNMNWFIKNICNIVHFFSLFILDLLAYSLGGIYFGKLPFSKYDQYISAVYITSFPLFSFPYSTGV